MSKHKPPAVDLAKSVATIRTIRIDARKLDQTLGAAAKPVCDFLENLADMFSPRDSAEDEPDEPADSETDPERVDD